MYSFTIILTTVIIHKLSNALDVATICDSNKVCKCNNNNVSCTKFYQDPPFILPQNITIVHFVDVPVLKLNNITFSNGKLQSITWIDSKIDFVNALNHKDLRYLSLPRNQIIELSDDTFNNCPNLKYIDLSDNQLSILPDNLFLNTKKLETLKLENNIFYSVSDNLFRETINLLNLSIGNPNLSSITKKTMSKLEKLEYLNIENSRIENLNANSFGEHKYLTNIKLNNCTNLKSIDNDFISSVPNIEVIELNNCNIINLPPNIISLKNLKLLQMFKTKVQSNCYNGWFSKWFNETSIVVGYESYKQWITPECPAKIYHTSGLTTLQLTRRGIINCMSYGNPPPAITWLVPGGLTFHKNKESDSNISHHPNVHNWDLNQMDSQSLLIDKNGSLHILRMLRNNVGNYTCYVSNKYGNDSKTVEVHLDSGVFFNIKINALILGIASALGFLMLTILSCALNLLLIRSVLLLLKLDTFNVTFITLI